MRPRLLLPSSSSQPFWIARRLGLGLSPLLVLATALACQAPPRIDQMDKQRDLALDAYVDYSTGDCEGVRETATESSRTGWPASEVRGSVRLLDAFCAERNDDLASARSIHRLVLRDDPLSFAAEDARDRLRVLRLVENDPEYEAWLLTARDRARRGSTRRVAVERSTADYPPLAQAAGLGGFAVVEFGVLPQGTVDAPVVVDAEPPLVFDGAALRAVRSWRYEPDPRGTESQRQAIRIVFRPEEADGASVDSVEEGLPENAGDGAP